MYYCYLLFLLLFAYFLFFSTFDFESRVMSSIFGAFKKIYFLQMHFYYLEELMDSLFIARIASTVSRVLHLFKIISFPPKTYD